MEDMVLYVWNKQQHEWQYMRVNQEFLETAEFPDDVVWQIIPLSKFALPSPAYSEGRFDS